jgi:transposase
MSRSLKIRKPNSVQIRRLHLVLEETTNKYLQRRAEAILFYASGLNAVEIAQVLHAHPNTIYADLHAFDQQGLGCLKPLAIGGRPCALLLNKFQKFGTWLKESLLSLVYNMGAGHCQTSRIL